MVDFIKTAASLAKEAGVEQHTVKVADVRYIDRGDFTVVLFNLANGCRGYVQGADDKYAVGTVDVISTTLNMWRMMLRTTSLSAVRKTVCATDDMLNLVLDGAELQVLSVPVKANVPHTNPFNDRKDVRAKVYDHDTIIHYVIGVRLSASGKATVADVRKDIIAAARIAASAR